MERIKKEDIEKMYGKMIEIKNLSILGFKGKMTVEIYDGFAYCPNFNGHEYAMKYPQLKFIEDSIEMQEHIRETLKMKPEDKISAFDVLQTYNEMDEDGVRIRYDVKQKKFVPKDLSVVIETAAA